MIELREALVLARLRPLGNRVRRHFAAVLPQSFQKRIERLVGEARSVESCTPDTCDPLLFARAHDVLTSHECDTAVANRSTEPGRQSHVSPLTAWTPNQLRS